VKRWLKRFWLRYLHFCKEHWLIAASLVLTALALIGQVLSLLAPLLEIVFVFA
jgi:hypothetical protein